MSGNGIVTKNVTVGAPYLTSIDGPSTTSIYAYPSFSTTLGPGDPNLVYHEWCSMKAQINGTLAHTTAIFGFMLAGLVVQDICQ